ncbi:MAG: 1-acyl-sn-glycerol-3-phosphate acyltransferase [Bacteroidota bacterium]|nr:1-acyl-sn-glycerol-3-phosphate acyltransferase [Bacteroidota bacterium]
MSKSTTTIDIEKILRSKAPNTKVPKFILNYLRRIVHERELNEFFTKYPGVKNLEFIEAAFDYLKITSSIEGKENLPIGGKYIFAGNHPLGGLDGITTGYLLGKVYDGKIRFFSNDILMNLEPMREMFIPVNKVGSQNKGHASKMQELYNSDNHLLTYPAGMCSRKINGKIIDLEWKKNFISKSIEYHRDIVPIYFEGRNSNFFYNLANIRKFFHIRFNIEMMYLVNELFKQKGKHFTIRIGKPIPWQTFNKSRSQMEWAKWVKDIVYSMA